MVDPVAAVDSDVAEGGISSDHVAVDEWWVSPKSDVSLDIGVGGEDEGEEGEEKSCEFHFLDAEVLRG